MTHVFPLFDKAKTAVGKRNLTLYLGHKFHFIHLFVYNKSVYLKNMCFWWGGFNLLEQPKHNFIHRQNNWV